MLEVVCKVWSGSFETGKPEGLSLTVPGAPYGPLVSIGAGITAFTTIPSVD
jgi:hypothetical protein